MIPDQLIKREISRINQKTKNSWEDLRTSIFDQTKTIENKLREIEAELAMTMVNDPHNEATSGLITFLRQEDISVIIRIRSKLTLTNLTV